MEHSVKIQATHAILHFKGLKPWEERYNDRDYEVDDIMIFNIVADGTSGPVFMTYRRRILYVYKGNKYGLKKDHCILTIK